MWISSSASSSGCTGQRNTRERARDWPSSNVLYTAMADGSGPRVQLIAERRFHSRSRSKEESMPERTEILLVEDTPDDIELALHALKDLHITNSLTIVRDGVEALEFFFGTGAYTHRIVEDL